MKNNLTASLGIILLAGCASTNVVKLNDKSYPAKPAGCAIKVMTQIPNTLKYEEIALLSARSGGNIFASDSVEAIIPDLKEQACELGADAIIMRDAKEGGMNWVGPKTRAEASATAIKFL